MSALAGVVAAQQPPEDTSSSPESATPTKAWIPIALRGLPPDLTVLCEDKPGGSKWIDHVQAQLYRTICLSAAGFDGFFGNARFDDEYEATRGSIAVGTLWDERDGWDPSVRFRVHMQLPQLSERFNAFIGRVDPEEFVTELRDDFDTLPRQFAREDDDAVLGGLGYSQPGFGGGRLDAGVGSRLSWPLETYAKGNYRFTLPFLDDYLLRLHETVFWQEGEGFGATTRTDLEHLLTETFLLRWTGTGRFSEGTDGLRWFSALTLYQSLGDGRAFSYQAGISGETGREVGITDYGLRTIYRCRIHSDWLFLELRGNVTWPRDTVLEQRETNWGGGAAVELLFGESDK